MFHVSLDESVQQMRHEGHDDIIMMKVITFPVYHTLTNMKYLSFILMIF